MASYTLSLLFVAYIFSFIDRQILALLVGPIRAEFGISDFQYSLLQGAAFAIIYTFAGLPLGRLADRKSRGMIIAVSVMFWSALTISCGLAKSFTQLFLSRMGVGVGEAGLSPAAYSLILDSFRPEHVGYAMAIYKIAILIGGGLALILGGAVYDYFLALGGLQLPLLGLLKPWQATFVAVGAPGILLSLLFLTITEPTRKDMVVVDGNEPAEQIPFRSVLAFLWERKRTYFSLFFGASMMTMAAYGSTAWYPEFLYRNYGLSKSEAGASFGTIILVAGSLGVLAGSWASKKLAERGYLDANVRVIVISSLLALGPTVYAPLAGSAELTLAMLIPATFFAYSFVGVLAVSLVVITPNQMRGQITAIYIFVTNIIGMTVGTSALAALTDFVYRDDGALNYSIATTNAVFYPLATLLFWYCLPAYRRSVEDARSWAS